MKLNRRIVPLLAILVLIVSSPRALVCQNDELQNGLSPTVYPAVDGIFAAFQNRPVVAIADQHALAQEEDFYAALVRDKRFPEKVGNVVVEFGAAAQQATLDRYVEGETIPYDVLRRVWTDTVGWIPGGTVNALGYMNFFAQVRRANSALPPDKRIRVWLGDPPIDWSRIKTREDFLEKLGERNQYPAHIIKTEILAKGKKALVIYGGFHFYGTQSLRSLVEQRYPGTFYLVTPYVGFTTPACSTAFEKAVRSWPNPALAAPVRDTKLEGLLRSPNCHFLGSKSISMNLASQKNAANIMARLEDQISGVDGDALLFLGPAASLALSPRSSDLYLDSAFRKEIERRSLIVTGKPFRSIIPVATPLYLHNYENPGSGKNTPE